MEGCLLCHAAHCTPPSSPPPAPPPSASPWPPGPPRAPWSALTYTPPWRIDNFVMIALLGGLLLLCLCFACVQHMLMGRHEKEKHPEDEAVMNLMFWNRMFAAEAAASSRREAEGEHAAPAKAAGAREDTKLLADAPPRAARGAAPADDDEPPTDETSVARRDISPA